MTDWIHYNASKYAAKCCYCNRDIHTSEGRWTAPHTDGTKGRFNACHNCIAPPTTGVSAAPPPKPSEIPSSVVPSSTPEPPAKPKDIVESTPTNTYTPENRIAKAHDDNMLSAELTRLCVTNHMRSVDSLRVSVDALCNAMNERTRILNEQLKEGGKQ